MKVRFTEFIKYEGKDIGLYVTQESQQIDPILLKIYVRVDSDTAVLLCKKEDANWKLLPQSGPQWVNKLEPILITTIEQKVSKILNQNDLIE